MLGKLIKGNKSLPIIEFTPPDHLLLMGDFSEFETSLKKSKANGYHLVDCDNETLLKIWEGLRDE